MIFKRREKKVRSLLRLWDELLKLNPGNIECRIITRGIRVEEVRRRAWFKLSGKTIEEDLCYLLVFLDRHKDRKFRDEVSREHYKLFVEERLKLLRQGKSLPFKATPIIRGNRDITKEIRDLVVDPSKRKIIEEMMKLSA